MAQKSKNAVDELVAQKIRSYRIRRGFTQTDLAEKLGVTFQQVQKYERGINRVGAGRLFDIARQFGVPIQALFPEHAVSPSLQADDTAHMMGLEALVSSIDTLRLVQAFSAISDTRLRKRILALVQELVRDEIETSSDLTEKTDS